MELVVLFSIISIGCIIFLIWAHTPLGKNVLSGNDFGRLNETEKTGQAYRLPRFLYPKNFI